MEFRSAQIFKVAADGDKSSRFALPNCVSKFRSLGTVASSTEVGANIRAAQSQSHIITRANQRKLHGKER
jgi:hypothetical protein